MKSILLLPLAVLACASEGVGVNNYKPKIIEATIYGKSFACKERELYYQQKAGYKGFEGGLMTDMVKGCTYTSVDRIVRVFDNSGATYGAMIKIKGLSGGYWWTEAGRISGFNGG